MILILADDFSGAFELSGIAAARGFAFEVSAVDTQKRLSRFRPSGGNPKRFARNGSIKTDSALRGNIAADRPCAASHLILTFDDTSQQLILWRGLGGGFHSPL